MKKVLLGIAIVSLFVLSGCFTLPSQNVGFDDPIEMVKSLEADLLNVAKNYSYEEDPLKVSDEVAKIIEKYYYLDNSLNDYEDGKDKAVDLVASQMALGIGILQSLAESFGGSIDEAFEVNNPNFSKIDTPTIPDAIQVSVDEVGAVTYTDGAGNDVQQIVVKIAGKWFAGIIYYDSGNVKHYPSSE